MAPAAPTKTPRASADKPYRRGVTLGKAMRRGKLDKGGAAAAAGAGAAAAGAGPHRGKAAGGARGKGKGRAPAPRAASESDDGEERIDEEEGEGAEGAGALVEGSEDNEPAAEPSPAAFNKRRVPRKAGGGGKKQKVFVEEKVRPLLLSPGPDSSFLLTQTHSQSDLLSLAASISGQAEAKTQERLEKAVRPAPLSLVSRLRADVLPFRPAEEQARRAGQALWEGAERGQAEAARASLPLPLALARPR